MVANLECSTPSQTKPQTGGYYEKNILLDR